MITAIKVGGIKLCDWLNKKNDPFQEFTRPAQPKYPELLSVKAARFEEDILKNHMIRGGTIFNYRIPTDKNLPLDLGDQAIWHGIWTATVALKCSLDPSTASRDLLWQCIIGLDSHQPNGTLIRGINESGEIQDEASNDQATGHLAGLYFAWLFGTGKHRAEVSRLIHLWATSILGNAHSLVNFLGGRPTKYGRLIEGWKTDPLRLTLCLAIYYAAAKITNSRMYLQVAHDLTDKYRDLIPYPKVRLWWIDTHYDTHRAALHLAILNDISPCPLFASGILRIMAMVKKEGNIWVNAICNWALPKPHSSAERQMTLKVLSEISFEDQMYDKRRENSKDPSIDKTIWDGKWVSQQPLPLHMRAAEDFPWQRNRFSLDTGYEPPASKYSGLGFLAAYWFMRHLGVLTVRD